MNREMIEKRIKQLENEILETMRANGSKLDRAVMSLMQKKENLEDHLSGKIDWRC